MRPERARTARAGASRRSCLSPLEPQGEPPAPMPRRSAVLDAFKTNGSSPPRKKFYRRPRPEPTDELWLATLILLGPFAWQLRPRAPARVAVVPQIRPGEWHLAHCPDCRRLIVCHCLGGPREHRPTPCTRCLELASRPVLCHCVVCILLRLVGEG